MDTKPSPHSGSTNSFAALRTKLLVLWVFALFVPLVGGCGSRSSPAYPPTLRIEPFRPTAESLVAVNGEVRIRIAGCRSTVDGLYAELFIVTVEQQDLAPILGDLAVELTGELFELRDGDGNDIVVRPAKRAARDYVETSPALSLAQLVTLSTGPSFGRGALAAQTYPVTPEVSIQTIPIRLNETLPEGEYQIRLTEAWAGIAASDLSPNDSEAVLRALGSSRITPQTDWQGFRIAPRHPHPGGSRLPW